MTVRVKIRDCRIEELTEELTDNMARVEPMNFAEQRFACFLESVRPWDL